MVFKAFLIKCKYLGNVISFMFGKEPITYCKNLLSETNRACQNRFVHYFLMLAWASKNINHLFFPRGKPRLKHLAINDITIIITI